MAWNLHRLDRHSCVNFVGAAKVQSWSRICCGSSHIAKRPIHHWIQWVLQQTRRGPKAAFGEEIGDVLPLLDIDSLGGSKSTLWVVETPFQLASKSLFSAVRRTGLTHWLYGWQTLVPLFNICRRSTVFFFFSTVSCCCLHATDRGCHRASCFDSTLNRAGAVMLRKRLLHHWGTIITWPEVSTTQARCQSFPWSNQMC